VEQVFGDGAGGRARQAQWLGAGGMFRQPGPAGEDELLKLQRAAGAAAEGIVHGRVGIEEGGKGGEVAIDEGGEKG
jgi:hypothetical protein